jgi:hypothetical protein
MHKVYVINDYSSIFTPIFLLKMINCIIVSKLKKQTSKTKKMAYEILKVLLAGAVCVAVGLKTVITAIVLLVQGVTAIVLISSLAIFVVMVIAISVVSISECFNTNYNYSENYNNIYNVFESYYYN